MRRTKIVATLGPATAGEKEIMALLKAGVNLFRFNMKYSPPAWHNQRILMIRKNAAKLNLRVGIIVDIPSSDFKIEINDYDWVALSYLKSAKEILKLKKRLSNVKVIAKIENGEAMDNLAEIVEASDGLMVARGDLGRETPIEELALFQKRIIDTGRLNGKPVIVATEMLYSMVKSNTPTRAEATDVANAVFDGTDALMLSEETALGDYPIEAVEVMAKIASFCENSGELRSIDLKAKSLVEALTESAARMVNDKLDKPIKAVLVFTRSGTTALMTSRYRLEVPAITLSNDEKVLNRLCLSFGVIPFFKKFNTEKYASEDPIFEEVKNYGLLKSGETILVIHGDAWFGQGPANRLSVVTLDLEKKV